ncbi:hypothetical protein ES702_06843 [subsurface metagenome]
MDNNKIHYTKLNQEKASQIECLRLIIQKMIEVESEFLGTSLKTIMASFNIDFTIEEGSIKGNVYYMTLGKLS